MFDFAACPHLRGSVPVAIESSQEIVWKCIDCTETWTDNTTPAEALAQGWVIQEELDALVAMR